jgi:hypothetical protein
LLLPALLPVPPLTAFVMPALIFPTAALAGLFALAGLPDVPPLLTGTAEPPVAVAVASVTAAPVPVVPAGTVLGAVTGTCSFGRPTSFDVSTAFGDSTALVAGAVARVTVVAAAGRAAGLAKALTAALFRNWPARSTYLSVARNAGAAAPPLPLGCRNRPGSVRGEA